MDALRQELASVRLERAALLAAVLAGDDTAGEQDKGEDIGTRVPRRTSRACPLSTSAW